mmetsp:Transcript_11672/g.32508  ORF Transcript_11672/g.32508 Transcript_11672/m.32508 type:complete len:311 (+) Transcript_11672:71-1003(+)|eukprot:CAMPEP_0113695156 /NCGR_PEP_ID=MMETSP0038_2-20120614/20733_1 /TAXON_ID=2898 /ORGANISM="Cryptomonas paramecium" /LENGTH=310 /DNA_ID=CAMNT_0000617647 /DNA_START=71 /DNA_END=1003 /DNA_ORIENTATION=+ /assembly_acc=CAM_ASM_000170
MNQDSSADGQQGNRNNDMFAGMREGSSEGSLLGPATVAVCFAVCCVCVFVGLWIAFIVWAIVTLVVSAPSAQSDCGRVHLMWEYVISVIVVQPILICCSNLLLAATQMVALAVIPSFLSLGLGIWGIAIWSQLGECSFFYASSYPDLFLLFKIVVIVFLVMLAIFLCVMCFAVCLLGTAAAGAIAGGGGKNLWESKTEKDQELREFASQGNYEGVENLLSSSTPPNVNSKDPSNGWTALHYAAVGNHRRIAERLVASGAKMDTECFMGKTPLQLAREQNSRDVLQFLEDVGARSSFQSNTNHNSATVEFV